MPKKLTEEEREVSRIRRKEKLKINHHNYYLKNKEILLTKSRKWDEDHKERRTEVWRRSNLKIRFGITLEDYNKMFEDQNGCCAICGIHNSKLKRNLHVDHSHETGKIRGLICHKCNSALGSFNDDTTVVKKAVEYLEGGK